MSKFENLTSKIVAECPSRVKRRGLGNADNDDRREKIQNQNVNIWKTTELFWLTYEKKQ